MMGDLPGIDDFFRIAPQMHSGLSFFPRENDTIPNPAWEKASVRIAIARLSPFSDVEESLTHGALFSRLRQDLPDAWLDFAFFPPRKDQALLSRHGMAWPRAIVSGRPLSDFDTILVSISYVLEAVNLMPLLTASGIPPLAGSRSKDHPLVVLGGSSVLLSQGLLPVVDAFFFGEFEASAFRLADLAQGYRSSGLSGRDWCRSAAPTIQGLWTPGSERAMIAKIPRGNYAMATGSYPVLNGSHADTVRLQISLGCPFRCSFCFEGFERKPYRDLDIKDLLPHVHALKILTGARSIDAVSFNFNTHHQLPEVMAALSSRFRYVHLMSQRLDILWRTPGLIDAETALGKRSFTLGVEGISGRMRAFFQKDLARDALYGITARLLQKKVRDFKFFYILSGLETPEDLDEFSSFVAMLRDQCKSWGGARVLFSFGVLMVMPHTPLQFLPPLWSDEKVTPLVAALKSLIEAAGFEFRLSFSAEEHQCAQYLACAGETDAHRFITAMHDRGLSWDGRLDAKALTLLPEVSLRPQGGLGYRHAFSFVHGELWEEELASAWLRVKAALSAAPVSAGTEMASPPERAFDSSRILRIEDEKKRPLEVHFQWVVPQSLALASKAWIEGWVWRQLASRIGQDLSAQSLLGIREVHHSTADRLGLTGNWTGLGIFVAEWRHPDQRLSLDRALGSQVLTVKGILAPPREYLYRWEFTSHHAPRVNAILQTELKDHHVPFTMSKPEGGYRYQVSGKQASKAAIKDASIWIQGDHATLDIMARPRFSADNLSRALYRSGILITPSVHVESLVLAD